MESMKLGKELVLGLSGEADEVDQDVRMDTVDDYVGGNMVLVLLCNNLKLDRCECEVEVVEAAVIQKKTEGDNLHLDMCEWEVEVVEAAVIQKKTEEDILHLDMCEWEVEVDREHLGMKAPMAVIQKIQKKGDSQDLDTCEWGVVVEVEVGWVRTGMKGQMAAIQGPEGDIQDLEAEKEVE